jgi:hypothetical protein
LHQTPGIGNGFYGIALGQAEQVAAFQLMLNIVDGIAGLPLDDIGQLMAAHLAVPHAPVRAALPENMIGYIRHQIV